MRPCLALLLLSFAACGGRTPPGNLGGDGGQASDGAVVHGDAGAHCDDIASRYLTLADQLNYCQQDADCGAFGAACDITTYAGLGACYSMDLNVNADRTQFATMELEWQAAGCPEPACNMPCPAPPQLACRDGRCVPLTGQCTSAECVSGPGWCCDRDCDPSTQQTCREVCPPVPPADPLCTCAGACAEVACSADGSCPAGSHCDGARCIRDQHCATANVGCKAFFSHCTCAWQCIDADAAVDDCPGTCPDEQQTLYFPPLCDCGAGGCGMRTCTTATDCGGFEILCREVPGSASYLVCTECAVCG